MPFETFYASKKIEIEPVEGAELTYEAGPGPSRIGLSAQVIREHGARMGTLVTSAGT